MLLSKDTTASRKNLIKSLLRRREVPFRVWGGRKHKQPALGIEFERRTGNTRVRAGAYGTQQHFGLALRIRY